MNLCEIIEEAYPFETFTDENGNLYMIGTDDELYKCNDADELSFSQCIINRKELSADYEFVGDKK